MGRPLRIAPEHGWHHLLNRGIRRNLVFRDEVDCRVFLAIVDEVFAEFGISVFAYCLVRNHYHMGANDTHGHLSTAMHRVGTRYARYFNDRHGFDGPISSSRYRSRLLTTDSDLVALSRYIHRNSLDVDPLLPPAEYPWSSFGAYLGARKSLGVLNVQPVLELAGGPSAYRRLVEDDITLGLPTPATNAHSGSVGIEEVEAEVRRIFEGDLPEGCSGDRGRQNDARSCVAFLASELCGLPPAFLESRYGYADRRSLTRAIARYRVRLGKDVDLAARHEQTRTNLILRHRSRTSRAA